MQLARTASMRPFSRRSSKKKQKDAAETALVAAFARLCTVEASRNEQKPRSLFDLSTDEPRLSSDLFASCVLGEFDGGLPKSLAEVVIRACDKDKDGLISKSEFAKAVKIARRGDARQRLALVFDGSRDKDASEIVALAKQIVGRGANDAELADRVALSLGEAFKGSSRLTRKKFDEAVDELPEEDRERASEACARVLCPAARGDGVVPAVRKRSDSFRSSRFPVARRVAIKLRLLDGVRFHAIRNPAHWSIHRSSRTPRRRAIDLKEQLRIDYGEF